MGWFMSKLYCRWSFVRKKSETIAKNLRSMSVIVEWTKKFSTKSNVKGFLVKWTKVFEKQQRILSAKKVTLGNLIAIGKIDRQKSSAGCR